MINLIFWLVKELLLLCRFLSILLVIVIIITIIIFILFRLFAWARHFLNAIKQLSTALNSDSLRAAPLLTAAVPRWASSISSSCPHPTPNLLRFRTHLSPRPLAGT